MNPERVGEVEHDIDAVVKAREEFRDALLMAHRSRKAVGHLEVAAARFCQAMRQQGETPERMLIDAKRVIEQTINGRDIPVAEKAVLVCIQHYYRR
jgi:hypothetical protein